MKLTKKQEKWLKLLESGTLKQTERALFDGRGYCCLGVAARFVCSLKPKKVEDKYDKYEFAGREDILGPTQVKALKLRGGVANIEASLWRDFFEAIKSAGYKKRSVASINLAEYNDTGATFKQIAKAIRKVPEAVFTNQQ